MAQSRAAQQPPSATEEATRQLPVPPGSALQPPAPVQQPQPTGSPVEGVGTTRAAGGVVTAQAVHVEGKTTRRRLLALGGLGVVLAAAAIAYVVNRDKPGDQEPPLPAACVATARFRGSAVQSSRPPPEPAIAPKSGYKFYPGAGYQVMLPIGWPQPTSDGAGGDCYADPNNTRWLVVAEVPRPATGAADYLRAKADAEATRLNTVQVAPFALGPDSAVWEFTWAGTGPQQGLPLHAMVTLWVRPNDQAFVLAWVTTEAQWTESQPDQAIAVSLLQ
jgi:hypothetical protein